MAVAEVAPIPFEDGRFYSENPFPTLAQLREEEPVYFREDLNMWFLTRYEDVVTVSRNAQVFSSASGVLLKQLTDKEASEGYFEVDTVATTDPPKHGELRRMVAPAFMPSEITPASSLPCDSTQLWPIAVTGSLPVCFRVTLNDLQVLGTVIVLVLNCIASLASTVAAHSAAISGVESRPSRAIAINLRMRCCSLGRLGLR